VLRDDRETGEWRWEPEARALTLGWEDDGRAHRVRVLLDD
jgi:hypothetical protein